MEDKERNPLLEDEPILHSEQEDGPSFELPSTDDVDMEPWYAFLAAKYGHDPRVHHHEWQVTVSPTHTAARWCTGCGKTYASTFAGDPVNLEWHEVRELNEQLS